MPELPSSTDTSSQGASKGTSFLDRLSRLARSTHSRDTLAVTCARLLQNVLGFVVSLAILKKFGLDGVGSYTIASFGVAVLATMLSFGLPFTLAKSGMETAQRNTVGLLAGGAAFVLSLPVGVIVGLGFGHDRHEALAIAVLVWGGAFFANNSILDALLVLQGKARRVLVVSGFYMAGVTAAAMLARDLIEFALLLALGRFLGQAAVYASLPYRWCGWHRAGGQLRAGARYLVPDSIGLLAEQLSIAILAPLTSRAEMGVYGLCRQFLSAAETPLWSRLVVLYPRLCARPVETLSVAREMAWRGVGVMAVLVVTTAILAQWLYESPEMLVIAPLLMLAIPLRYVAGTSEIGLRALGAVGTVNRLGLVRLGLLALIPVGLHYGRLEGVVAVVILQGAVMAALGARALRRAQPLPQERRSQPPAQADSQVRA